MLIVLVLFINLFHHSGFIEDSAVVFIFLHCVISINAVLSSVSNVFYLCTLCAVGDNGILVLPPCGACAFASIYEQLSVLSW